MLTKRLLGCLSLYSAMMLLLTGCWDQINIEDRGFVVGVAIDQLKEGTHGNPQIKVMNQFVIPSKLGGVENSTGDEKPFTNVFANGRSLTEIAQNISALTARQPFFEHMKVVVFSEELAKESGMFESIVDVFIRYHEVRRGTRVIISDGKAHNILDIVPEANRIPAMYIDSLIENSKINLELLEPVKLGDLHAFLINEDSYAISHAKPLENRIKADGVSVFNGFDNRLVGTLNSEETKGLNLITRHNKGGVINFEISDHLMVFGIEQTKSSIDINTEDPKHIKIAIHIEAEGVIQEMFGDKSLLTKQYMDEMETQINKRIQHLATQTINKAQQELKVDFLGFSNLLRQRHYDTWKHIKDKWDRQENLFSTSDITVSVNSEILSIGATDRTKVKRKD